jgi:VTC domain
VSLMPRPDRRAVSAALDSPALYRGDADVPAFEVKFLLSESEAREAEKRLRTSLASDPNADPALGGAYRVTSVYFDTTAFDVYRRTEGFRRRKYRVRRYGTAAVAFLEQKAKRAGQVRKRRTAVPLAELARLAGEVAPDWAGAWFVERLTVRGLRPVCRVSYDRVALVGTTAGGPIRVTFDRSAAGAPAAGADPDRVEGGRPLLNGEVIAEMKFLGAMPAVFKEVVEGLRLAPRAVSKYRRCVEAAGLAPAGGGHA